MQEKELIERLVQNEQRSKSNTKRLDEHEEHIKELSNVYVALTKVDDKVSNVENDVSEIKKDLKDIKEKPSKNWDNLKWIIVTRNCNSSSGFLFGKIGVIEGSEGNEKVVKMCRSKGNKDSSTNSSSYNWNFSSNGRC